MKSELLELLEKHREEIDRLTESCKHKPLFIVRDGSCIGRGSIYESISVICANCGKYKLMFPQTEKEAKAKIVKTLSLDKKELKTKE